MHSDNAAPVDEAKERAEFEATMIHEPIYIGAETGAYINRDFQNQWKGWKAARARSDARAKVAEAECERLRNALDEIEAMGTVYSVRQTEAARAALKESHHE